MKTILLHSDFIEFEAKKKAVKKPEEIDVKKHRVEDCLVAMSAVEKNDETDTKGIALKFTEEVISVAEQVNTKNVVIYPWVHLTSTPSKPDAALKVMKLSEDILSEKGYIVSRAPFGWYKSFNIKCKGHPLSELSRDIAVGEAVKKEEENEAVKNEDKLRSTWHILDVDGKLIPADKFDYSKYPELKKFYQYEMKGSRINQKEPPHIAMMRNLELVDYEPGSDSGNLRWYPKGQMIKKLLETKVTDLVKKAGAMQVETPLMYDFEHPQLSKYLNRFPARQYVIKSDNKDYFLRFAACFGQYLMGHDMVMSYKHLPVKLYELTHYSFRREQRGELSGLKRLRAFTMPDMHTMCADMPSAKKEFMEQYKLAMEWMRGLDMDYDIAIRFVKDFYYENEEFAKDLAKLVGKPILIELWEERFFYFVMKFEFSVNDSLGKASTLSTVQIDVENTERFDITYVDEKDKKVNPLLLHASISGGIDRNLWALLERQAINAQQGKKSMLPVWLSPTQVRVIPVSEGFVGLAEEISSKIGNSVRVDIDDRDLKVGKKIRDAEKEWVPYVVVVGENEKNAKEMPVRIRMIGKQENLSVSKLQEMIADDMKDNPFERLPLPKLLSKRPKFVG
ncbi:MAG: threonine--tRNA ligase [Nanohaloarchaea archaeon]|nr:threonine--tRNA ligase [Candidatus Nanohaloarchaea archaeon]